MAVSQATTSPIQRPCQMPRSTSVTCCGTRAFMTRRSEPALRNDHDVAGPHLDVGGDVAASNEILEPHAVLLSAFGGAQHGRVVAVGEVGEAADRDHHVEQRHPLPVRQGPRARRLPAPPDLLPLRAVGLRDEGRYPPPPAAARAY